MDISNDRYGSDWADDYDELTPIPQEQTEAAVSALGRLAGTGRVLELAAGTGRIALGLADRGFEVVATDISPDMLARLRAKDPEGRIETRVESMIHISGDERFALVALVYNSLCCLTTQEDQLAVFATAARHLAADGAFVVESALVDPRDFREARPYRMTSELLFARFGQFDVYTQLLDQHYLIGKVADGTFRIRPDVARIAPPAELDLMARLAGLRLRERWSDWYGGRALHGPGTYVSVYEPAA